MLKSYDENQQSKTFVVAPKPSGVACAEKDCPGEMMIVQPEINHPELDLKRAVCNICFWKGWV